MKHLKILSLISELKALDDKYTSNTPLSHGIFAKDCFATNNFIYCNLGYVTN